MATTTKKSIKIPGLTWTGKAWKLRVTAEAGPLKTEKTKTIAGTPGSPPVAALEALRAEAQQELERQQRGETGTETLGVFAQRWLERVVARQKSEAFVSTRTNYLERFILPVFGHQQPAAIRPRHLEDWQPWLVDQRKANGEPYGHETLASVWSTMRLLCRFFSVQLDIANPMQEVVFGVQGAEAKLKDVVEVDELSRLIEVSESISPDMRVMIVVGFGLGFRFCELSALWWSDIDLERGTLRIRRSQVGGTIGSPKTAATRRLVYIPPEIVTLLREHQRWQQANNVPGLEKGLVFPSRTGGYRYTSVMTKPLARLCDLAGLDRHLTSHCLRHTANNLLREVASEIVVRAMIGHAGSASQMTQRYSRVAERERRDAHRAAFGGALGWESSQAVGELPS